MGAGYSLGNLVGYNPLLAMPISDAPEIDTDPYSPTYGQPVYRKLSPRATGPDYQTTQKGNPGQPGAGVPTTAQGNDGATFEMVPPPGTPSKAPAKPAPAAQPAPAKAEPDWLEDYPHPTQAAPETAPHEEAAPADDHLENYPLPNTATAPSSGQYLSAGTSPGAKATGTPIAEGRVPG